MSGNGSKVSKVSVERGHEQSDLSIRTLFGGLFVLVVFTALAIGAMTLMWGWLNDLQSDRVRPSSPLVETDITPPTPRLETRSGEVIERTSALRQMQGSSYTWVDREAGIARIPVRRAMEILAARGLPSRDTGEGTE